MGSRRRRLSIQAPPSALTSHNQKNYDDGARMLAVETISRPPSQETQAMMYQHQLVRHKTREVQVGDKVVGGDNPIWVQSMTTPDTHDVEATVAEIHRLEEAGCELVRVTVPKAEDAAVLGEIKKRIHIPLICDIHFDYKMALAALDHPDRQDSHQPRQHRRQRPLSPGHPQGQGQGHPDAHRRQRRQPGTRVGEKYGFPCPPAMVDSALRYIEIAESRRLSRHDRVAEVERRADRRRGVSAVRQAGELSDAHRHHRGGQGALRRHQVGVRPGADPARRHRRHHPHQPARRPGAGDRGGVRHPASDAAARAQAGADRLPDLRPAGDRPGRHHRRAGKAAGRHARRR